MWTPCSINLESLLKLEDFLSLCSPSHISALERSQMFGGCELTAPLKCFFHAQLKMETQKGFLFLDYRCKMIQNMQCGKGAR